MGNNSSHKQTEAPKQACKERLPDMDKAQQKQFLSHLKRKQLDAKIVLFLSREKRQQRAEEAAGPEVRAPRSSGDWLGARAGVPTASLLLGAGDGTERCECAHAREMKKLLVLLLRLEARLQEAGPPALGSEHLCVRLLTDGQGDPEPRPRKRRRCPRPRS